MKIIFLLLVLMSAASYAQVDSLREKLGYYPLQTGNY